MSVNSAALPRVLAHFCPPGGFGLWSASLYMWRAYALGLASASGVRKFADQAGESTSGKGWGSWLRNVASHVGKKRTDGDSRGILELMKEGRILLDLLARPTNQVHLLIVMLVHRAGQCARDQRPGKAQGDICGTDG